MHSIFVKFPGDASFTEITRLVRHQSMSLSDSLMSSTFGSTRQIYRFSIRHDSTITTAFYGAGGKIEAYVLDADLNRIITGAIEPTFSQEATDQARDMTLEIGDVSYLLDESVGASLQLPADVTAAGPKIYLAADTGSVLYKILQTAGIEAMIDSGAPDIDITVRAFAMDEDQGTYRDEIDELLSEHGYVLRTTAAGKFTWYQWAKDAYTVAQTIHKDKSVAESFMVSRRYDEHDGAEVHWATAEVINDVRLWDANLPVNAVDIFSGVDIAAGDYWPKDGDIEDIHQDYIERWLDIPYLAGAGGPQLPPTKGGF